MKSSSFSASNSRGGTGISFREYKSGVEIKKYVGGGFGALGNPSSFHNELVRQLRLRIMMSAVPLFSTYEAQARKGKRRYAILEQLLDRMLFRPAKDKPTAESWHRDISLHLEEFRGANIDEGDIVFGGWIEFWTHPLPRIKRFRASPKRTQSRTTPKFKARPVCSAEKNSPGSSR